MTCHTRGFLALIEVHVDAEAALTTTELVVALSLEALVDRETRSEVLDLGVVRAGAVLGPLVVPERLIALMTWAREPVLVEIVADRSELLDIELGATAVHAPLRPETMDGPITVRVALLERHDIRLGTAFDLLLFNSYGLVLDLCECCDADGSKNGNNKCASGGRHPSSINM